MVLSETRWPTAFCGYPRGYRVAAQTPVHKGNTWPTIRMDTHPRTERLENPTGQHHGSQGEPETAQAACFKCLASKLAPFFQMIKVIAAIFLATVRRAIVGFMPLARNAS